jgi:N-acetylglucosamine repressor
MSGGRLLRGHSGLAGEVGHVTVVPTGGERCGCGNRGCLETVASDTAFARRASTRLGRSLTVETAIELAQSGRAPLAAELRQTAEYLGLAVAAVVNLFNPATVFIHSRVLDADDTLFGRVVERAEARALPPSFADCRVERAKGTKRQGAVAGVIRHLTDAVVPGLEHV